jgi:hypothetical protein
MSFEVQKQINRIIKKHKYNLNKMRNNSLVITSISNSENKIIQDYAKKAIKHDYNFIVVGDEQSPDNFYLKDCEFLSLKDQLSFDFELSTLLPVRHYTRKNIGYLKAMKDGSETIVETDDDNFARDNFWNKRDKYIQTDLYENTGWLNVYKFFSKENIWPRGFSIERLKDNTKKVPVKTKCFCPIQQGLADENPDVDAIFRLLFTLPVNFIDKLNLALGKNAWCPFNSQNTTWFKEAFMLMYLPSYCSFRMTDIWRSFIAQRICWENDFSILFHEATVWQERNYHDLLKDFTDEIPGYVNNNEIVKKLESLNLKKGIEYIPDNLLECYNVFINMNLIDKKEISLIKAWINDVNSII